MNKTITVKISSLPKSIQNDAVNFEKEFKLPQLSVGPISPNAGPILPIEAAEADTAVIIFSPFSANTIDAITKIKSWESNH